ncbi:MAG: PilZ domain-containing protein [Thermodesulfobacteriota bacterium]
MKRTDAMERRICDRFELSGATVSYKKKGVLGLTKSFVEISCPVVEVSYGGVRFLNNEPLSQNQDLLVDISLPENKGSLILQGKVIWCDLHPGGSYRYQTGFQFHPYGPKKGQNDPSVLTRLKNLSGMNIAGSETL